MKPTKKKLKDRLFYLFLLFAVFGVFLLYLAWTMLRDNGTPNPSGARYMIPSEISTTYPDALYYDFEQAMPKGVFTENNAHSGAKSLIATNGNSEPAIINIPLGAWDEQRLKYINMTGWIYAGETFSKEQARLIMIISNPVNDVKFSKAINLQMNPTNRWFRVNLACEPSSYRYSPDDRLRIYIKNTTGARILCDDLTVQFGKKCFVGEADEARWATSGEQFTALNTPPYAPIMLDYVGAPTAFAYETPTDSGLGADDILNATLVATGSFFTASATNAEILTFDKNVACLYRFSGISKPVNVKRYFIPDTIGPILQQTTINCGDFDGDGLTEAILWQRGTQRIIVAQSERAGASKALQFNAAQLDPSGEIQMVAALDADHNRVIELLVVDVSGNWKILKWRQGQWSTFSSSKAPKPEWNSATHNVSIVMCGGGSLPGDPCVLGISKTRTTGVTQYSLYLYDKSVNDFVPVYKKNNGQGLFSGKDRLSPNDRLVPVRLSGDKGLQWLRFTSDWRFDVQLLAFNDTAYTVLGSIDFSRNAQIENPKYSEKTLILPVSGPDGRNMLLVISGSGIRGGGATAGNSRMDMYRYEVSKKHNNLPGK